jgi:aspartyl aminopeptidase
MDGEKTEGQKLNDRLSYKPQNAWEKYDGNYKKEALEFSEGYKRFLDEGKTEREFIKETEKLLKQEGFISLDTIINDKRKISPGTKIYRIGRNKTAIICVMGSKPVTDGVNIVGAHIDSPRLDLKQNPLYEDSGMVLLKTHYYGGIKKYQWVTIPLSLHGIIIKKDGSKIELKLGEDENDPVFTITDLLPHLAKKQMEKKLSEGIEGEDLNVLSGSIPYDDEKIKDKVKLNILKVLNDKYGLTEEDFLTAELEVVPAFKAKDVGFDRSLIGAYGQDDRVCAYTALKAVIDMESPKKTALCVLADKEEIGSMGNTGSQSSFLENFIADICSLTVDNYSDITLRRCLENSKMLSADVNPGVDPTFENVHDKKNSSWIGKGIVIQKYTGSRGKAGASDANAEYLAQLRNLFNENNIVWQSGEIGKVDLGGGGTIAQYIANMGIEVVDCGIAIFSMHAPYEVTSKIDIYVTYNAYKVFYKI